MARAIIDPLDTGNYVNPCEALDNTISSSRIAQTDLPVTNEQQIISFNIYPNPSNGNITIDYQLNGKAQLEVYDLTGKLVSRIDLDASVTKKEANLSQQNGVYLYIVRSDNEILKTGKLVIVQ